MSVAEPLVTLGGRRFKVIDFDRRTVAQDHYLMTQLRKSGMDKVLPTEESDAEWLARLQTTIIDSGLAPELIAGYLMPEGKTERDWTRDMAADTARHIAACDTREDRDQVMGMAMQCAMGFFQQAAEQYNNFRDSLAARTNVMPGVHLH